MGDQPVSAGDKSWAKSVLGAGVQDLRSGAAEQRIMERLGAQADQAVARGDLKQGDKQRVLDEARTHVRDQLDRLRLEGEQALKELEAARTSP